MTDYPQPQRADLLDKQTLLDGLITAAVSRPEIHDVIERHTVTEAALRADAVDQGPTVFRTAEGEEQAWREAASPRDGGIVKTVLALVVFPTAQIAVLAWLVLSAAKVGGWPRLLLFIGVALGALVIGAVLLRRRNRMGNTSVGIGWMVLGLLAWLIGDAWLAFLWAGWSLSLVPVCLLAALVFALSFVPMGMVSPSTKAADRQKVDDLFSTWQSALMEKGLMPILRTFINVRETENDYSTTLAVRATP